MDFVARAVCNLVETNPEEAETFLKNCFLSHEILFFAGEIMKSKAFDYESNLLHLIKMTRNADKINRINPGYLGGNAVNLLYRYKGKLPGKDWSNLILDGAILPFADLSWPYIVTELSGNGASRHLKAKPHPTWQKI